MSDHSMYMYMYKSNWRFKIPFKNCWTFILYQWSPFALFLSRTHIFSKPRARTSSCIYKYMYLFIYLVFLVPVKPVGTVAFIAAFPSISHSFQDFFLTWCVAITINFRSSVTFCSVSLSILFLEYKLKLRREKEKNTIL